MSRETVQFVELVRRAAASMRLIADYERLHYCQTCGELTLHSIKSSGLHETFICTVCGSPTIYTVR